MEYRYWAYISYSHRDQVFSRKLHRSLERYKIPKNLRDSRFAPQTDSVRMGPVFRDREDLSSASSLSAKIYSALDASSALIVICSTHAAQSKWVDEEITYFLQSGRAERIFPIIINGEPNTSDENECFPPELRAGGALEPIAADIRKGRDAYKDALLKIISGVLSVEFDTLKHRAIQAQLRQMVFSTGIAMLVAMVTSGLAVFAYQQQQIAQQRRLQAEDLISFMLGDLRDRLQDLGRLDVLDKVGDQADEYFRTVPSQELNDHSLEKRALSLRQIGEVRLDQGRFEVATDSFNDSLVRFEALVQRLPDDSRILFELGQAQFWVGTVHYQNVRLDQARVYYDAYLDTSKKLFRMAPDDVSYQMEILYAYSNLGTLATEQGDSQGAISHFSRSIDALDPMLKKNPDSPELNLELAGSLSWLSKLASDEWRLEDAVTLEQRTESILGALVNDTTPYFIRDYYAASCNNLANLFWNRGDIKQAEKYIECANVQFNQLTAHDPANVSWKMRGLSARVLELQLTKANGGDIETASDDIQSEFTKLQASSSAIRDFEQYYRRFYAIWLMGALSLPAPLIELVETELQDNRRQIETACLVEFALANSQPGNYNSTNCTLAPPHMLTMEAAAWRSLLARLTGDNVESENLQARLLDAGFKQPDYLMLHQAL